MQSIEPSGITNQHRIDYVLDTLAESFPEKAKRIACACGNKGPGKAMATMGPNDKLMSKRDHIEGALLEAWEYNPSSAPPEESLDSLFKRLSDDEVGTLLKLTPVSTVDCHLHDHSLFLDPERKTTFNEVKEWDLRHKNDFK